MDEFCATSLTPRVHCQLGQDTGDPGTPSGYRHGRVRQLPQKEKICCSLELVSLVITDDYTHMLKNARSIRVYRLAVCVCMQVLVHLFHIHILHLHHICIPCAFHVRSTCMSIFVSSLSMQR